ncbi:hypothetical protein DL765_009285 [Monosporascus sp. GIB2]|nr:hypothetical protein DL765_009285 [Monosporascus sp. GIB2]
MAVSKSALDVISRDALDDHGLLMQTSKATLSSLSPGPKLDALNRNSVGILSASLEDLAASIGEPKYVKMYGLIHREITMATTEGIFGDGNPFRDPKVQEVWDTYERGFVRLTLIGVAPALTARECFQARKVLIGAFEKYYAEGGYSGSEASSFVKDRYEFFIQRGLEQPDIARVELTTAVALFANTVPATFWLVYHILSEAAVFSDCYKELSGAVRERDGHCTVDIDYIRSSCPVFVSTFQEVMRFHGIGMTIRVVTEDSTLSGKFLLKKGGLVLIPAETQHSLRSAWGENVGEFDHRRFIQKPGSKTRRHDPVAFRAFGGGLRLCPGRHLAFTETLALASFIILRFDVRPMSGHWTAPTTAKSSPGVSIAQPDYDIDIEIRPRDRRKWIVVSSGAAKAMMVSAEDIANNRLVM